jgi:hypothetical protein
VVRTRGKPLTAIWLSPGKSVAHALL